MNRIKCPSFEKSPPGDTIFYPPISEDKIYPIKTDVALTSYSLMALILSSNITQYDIRLMIHMGVYISDFLSKSENNSH